MILNGKQTIEQLSQTDLFQKISDICAIVNTVITPHQLLESSLISTMDLFGAHRGSIFILQQKSRELICESAIGMKIADKNKLVKKLGEGVVGRVAESKKPIYVDDISKDERFVNYKARGSYRTPSFICVPLLIKDQLIGVINIADKEYGTKRFGSSELQLIDFIASQIALNYRRIQLYQKFKSIVKKSKNLENELGKSSKEASHLKKQVIVQEKFATVGKLAGGIAHEFNNPLDGVMRYTNLCLEHVKDEVVRGYLLEIKHGLKRMANIVKNLLACSRVSTSNVALVKIDPNVVIEQSIQAVQSDIALKKVAIKTSLSKELPPIIDMGIERVVTNLLRNAIEAVEDDGKVEISTSVESNNFIIQIKDNGCGFLQEDAEKIFEPFYTTKDIEKGCGLGLTIASEIVKNYNGQIAVESVPKKGTTFIVSLPIK